jgi:threonine/homoserine/homoserine lactone efflux protein
MDQSAATLWIVFSMSFLVALTGALSPGPLLSYTIIQSASRPAGYLMAFG